MVDQALANLLVILKEQAVPLIELVQSDRANLLAQIATLAAQRDANALQAAGLNREKYDLIAQLDALRASHAAAVESLERQADELRARIDALAPPGGGVPINEFRRRLIPLRLALVAASEPVQSRWAAVLPQLDFFTTIYPQQSPVADLIAQAVADGLVSQEQAVALKSPVGG